jgi:cellulose biosynthesis protein BcsQ
MGFVVAVVSFKGGTGKTSIATSLFAQSVSVGESAGLTDFDPQGNATGWCVGWDAFRAVTQRNSVAALAEPHGRLSGARVSVNHAANPVSEIALPCTRLEGGWVVPAGPNMAVHTMQSVDLHSMPWDTVVVDTPPHIQSELLRSIVHQADAVLVPIQPETWPVQNVQSLVGEIVNAGRSDLVEKGGLRFVLNMVSKCSVHTYWHEVLKRDIGGLLSEVVIPRAAAWSEMATPGVKWSKKSKPATVAAALWAEMKNTQRRAAA